jgi:hypothetical protein
MPGKYVTRRHTPLFFSKCYKKVTEGGVTWLTLGLVFLFSFKIKPNVIFKGFKDTWATSLSQHQLFFGHSKLETNWNTTL